MPPPRIGKSCERCDEKCDFGWPAPPSNDEHIVREVCITGRFLVPCAPCKPEVWHPRQRSGRSRERGMLIGTHPKAKGRHPVHSLHGASLQARLPTRGGGGWPACRTQHNNGDTWQHRSRRIRIRDPVAALRMSFQSGRGGASQATGFSGMHLQGGGE